MHTRRLSPGKVIVTIVAILISTVSIQECRAASDCDVEITKVKSVMIEDNKITVVAEANIGMVIITPELPKDGKSARFTGRHSTWIRIKADEATFTVLPPHGRTEPWKEMTMQAAKDLKEGKEIGRIGYYRPEIIIKENRIVMVTGKAYIYPKRTPAKPTDEPTDHQ